MQRAALLASLLLTACASSTEPPIARDDAAVARVIASTIRPVGGGGELDALLDAAALVRGDTPSDLVREDDRTVRGQRAGFSFAYAVACRDDHNVAQACARSADNADVDASWTAVVASDDGVVVSSRAGTWVVNNIASDRIRIDGDGHFETVTDEAQTLSYDASYRNMIVFPMEPWPRGGLVRYEVLDEQRTDTLRAEAQFAASGHVTIVLADHAYDLDLATGAFGPAPTTLE